MPKNRLMGNGPFMGIAPTDAERRAGRLMRAPDHNAGTGGGNEGETDDEKAAREAAEADAEAARRAAEEEEEEDDDDNDDVEDLAAAKAALAAAKKETKAAKAAATKARKEAEKFKGIDPEKARANEKKIADAEKAAREAAKAQAEAEGNFEKLRQLQNEEHEAALKAERDRADAAEARANELESRANRAQRAAAFAGSAVIGDTILTPAKAERLYGDHVEIEDGELVVYDKPAGAKGRAKIMNSRGVPLPFDEALRKVIEADPDKDSLLKSKVKPGGGSKTEDAPSTPSKSTDRLGRIADGLRNLAK